MGSCQYNKHLLIVICCILSLVSLLLCCPSQPRLIWGALGLGDGEGNSLLMHALYAVRPLVCFGQNFTLWGSALPDERCIVAERL